MFYFSCIGGESELAPINEIFQSDSRFYCVYQRDIYSGEQWCEILPAKATKANAIVWLKEYLGCDTVISFGDGKNDIPMFEISDECYAVLNADPELKKKATAMIDTNDKDGVARWLKEKLL
jgi:hydroxymethylpyrimidine pyrophosphatase-like HAD family hydrolase